MITEPPLIVSWCSDDQCNPCKPKVGQLYIEGNTWFTFLVNAGGDGKAYLCHAVYQIEGIPQNYNINVPLTGSTTTTWHAYSTPTPKQPNSVPISGSITLTSTGHYGGWYGEFPPVQWTILPKTYLGVEVNIDQPVTIDPPVLSVGTLWIGQDPPWHDWLLTPLGVEVKVELV